MTHLKHARPIYLALLTALVACGGSSDTPTEAAATTGPSSVPTPAPSSSATPSPSPTPAPTPAPAPTPIAPAPTPSAPAPTPPASAGLTKANIFYSGHSLTNRPLPNLVSSIAASQSRSSLWNQHVIIGSPIRARTRGTDPNGSAWPGYLTGEDRDGHTINFLDELRSSASIGGQRYDALVITERHDLPLLGEDTVRYARHVHERFIEGNAAGVSYIYHAWQSVNNKANPTAWITHERNVAQSWQCVASRINTSLAHEGRTDRMHYLPAGLALARLVELATQGQVNGITGASTTETLNRLFADDVHLTELGQYYMALVTYASVFKVSPVGASYPASVSATQAASLQSLAWTTANAYRVDPMRPSMSECTAHARATFCPQISYYLNLPHELNNCVTGFSHASTVNPFYFNASVDPSYWLPAP